MTLSTGGLRPRRARRQGGIDRDFGYDASNPYQGAFPNTPILDTFNASAAQPLTTRDGWRATPFLTSQNSFVIPTATPDRASGTVQGGNAWGGTSYSDSEVYCTLLAYTPSSDAFHLSVRIQGYDTPTTYYGLFLAESAVTDMQLGKIVSNTKTLLGTLTPTTFTPGDSYGLSVYGNRLTSWYKSGAGAWVQKDTTTDGSITGPGGIGFGHGVASLSLDNFGGTGDPAVPSGVRSLNESGRRVWAGRS
jgi:hypothetical protein